MKFKKGVKINGLKPEMIIAMMVVENVYASPEITSGVEGEHMRASLHLVGHAIDVGIQELSSEQALLHKMAIAYRLTDEYDVILESDHIHIEFQPK